jgi:RNA polymerase sigma-70 factor (ECF subfamily)
MTAGSDVNDACDKATIFEGNRARLVALGYRMLGDVGRAEDIVQDAWLRWQQDDAVVENPTSYLVTIVTRLCLNELDSARARKEESRSDRLPEPVDLGLVGLDRLERADQVSMAFLVAFQRLTPAERAVLLLHEVFEFDHAEIGALLDRSEEACRQLLRRARANVAGASRSFETSPQDHRRLMRGFMDAAAGGRIDELVQMLAEDAILVSDAGPTGVTIGGVRNLPRPVKGARKVATAVAALARRGPRELEIREAELNGKPGVVVFLLGKVVFAIQLAIEDGRIRRIFIHADPKRLSHVPASA